jgi:hypothetical protein
MSSRASVRGAPPDVIPSERARSAATRDLPSSDSWLLILQHNSDRGGQVLTVLSRRAVNGNADTRGHCAN